jgi:hypothetical protein
VDVLWLLEELSRHNADLELLRLRMPATHFRQHGCQFSPDESSTHDDHPAKIQAPNLAAGLCSCRATT